MISPHPTPLAELAQRTFGLGEVSAPPDDAGADTGADAGGDASTAADAAYARVVAAILARPDLPRLLAFRDPFAPINPRYIEEALPCVAAVLRARAAPHQAQQAALRARLRKLSDPTERSSSLRPGMLRLVAHVDRVRADRDACLRLVQDIRGILDAEAQQDRGWRATVSAAQAAARQPSPALTHEYTALLDRIGARLAQLGPTDDVQIFGVLAEHRDRFQALAALPDLMGLIASHRLAQAGLSATATTDPFAATASRPRAAGPGRATHAQTPIQDLTDTARTALVDVERHLAADAPVLAAVQAAVAEALAALSPRPPSAYAATQTSLLSRFSQRQAAPPEQDPANPSRLATPIQGILTEKADQYWAETATPLLAAAARSIDAVQDAIEHAIQDDGRRRDPAAHARRLAQLDPDLRATLADYAQLDTAASTALQFYGAVLRNLQRLHGTVSDYISSRALELKELSPQ